MTIMVSDPPKVAAVVSASTLATTRFAAAAAVAVVDFDYDDDDDDFRR